MSELTDKEIAAILHKAADICASRMVSIWAGVTRAFGNSGLSFGCLWAVQDRTIEFMNGPHYDFVHPDGCVDFSIVAACNRYDVLKWIAWTLEEENAHTS